MSHDCKQEMTIKELIEFKGFAQSSLENIEKGIKDIKDNHLSHIYKEIKCITKKLSSKRPSWTIVWILTSLTSLVGILLTVILMKVVAR